MSSSDQGDQIAETGKDEDSEISSTTPDNGGEKLIVEDVSGLTRIGVEPIPIDAVITPGTSDPVPVDTTPVITITEGDIDLKVASTTTECLDPDSNTEEMETKNDVLTITKDDIVDESIVPKVEDIKPKSVISGENNVVILADADKDSGSFTEEFELRWNEDDDDIIDETSPTADVLKQLDQIINESSPTADVLKQLDQVIGNTDTPNEAPEDDKMDNIMIEKSESVTEKSELANVKSDEQLHSNKVLDATIEDFDKSEHKNDKDFIKSTSSHHSNKDEHHIEETVINDINSKILDCVDVEMAENNSVNKPVEIENSTDISSSVNIEKPVICDQVDILTKAISDQDIFMDKDDIIETPCKSPTKAEMELKTESRSKDEEMDVDTEIRTESKVDNILTEKGQIKEVIEIKQEISSEITKEVTYKISKKEDNKLDDSKTNEVANIDREDDVKITPSDDPSVSLPVGVSTISDIIEPKNKEKTIKPPSESLNEPEVLENTQDADNKKMDRELEHTDIENVDRNISQITDDSILDSTITPNIHHRINKPNIMLDIPTQELSDIEAELDDDDVLDLYDQDCDKNEKTQESLNSSENSAKVLEPSTDIDMKESIGQNDIPENIVLKPITMDVDSAIVEIEVELSKLTVPLLEQEQSDCKTSKPTHEIDEKKPPTLEIDAVKPESKSTLEIHDEKPSTLKLQQEIDGETPTTSNPTQEIDDKKPSSLKLTQEIDDKNQLTLKSKQEIHDEKQSTLKLKQEMDDETLSTSKSTQEIDDIKPMTSNPTQENDDEKRSSLKLKQEIDHEISLTSKSTQEIGDKKPVTSKPAQENDDEKPSSLKLKQEIDCETPSTSKSTHVIDDEKQSTSKSTQEIDDEKQSTSKSTQEIDDEKPSTSKSGLSLLETLAADNIDNAEEVTDSLGLLAESSRVVDDDNDDDEDPEADDNDDDDDFDPYEETNSEMAEDMEESSTPPPDLDPKEIPEPSPKILEERESDEGTMDIAEGSIDIVDDIECEETELLEMEIPDDVVLETPLIDKDAEKDEPEIIDADTHNTKKKGPPEKVASILENILGGPKKLQESNVRTFIELDESSDSDDVLEVSKTVEKDNIISVNIPKGVEVMSTSGSCSTSEIVSKEGEVIISGVPKPPPQKMSKINTSEVSIKTVPSSTKHVPDIPSAAKTKGCKDEIFNLDSDEELEAEEDTKKKVSSPVIEKEVEEDPANRADMKCINPECANDNGSYYQADRATSAYYSLTRRAALVCERCRQCARDRNEALMKGIRDLRPFLDLEMDAPSQQLVEISDSDSDGEVGDDTSFVGEKDAKYIEENFADMINETWMKYNMESRLKDTETYLLNELEKIEASAKEIDNLLDECQKKTDSVRFDFYKNYIPRRKSVGGIVIHDTPFSSYSHTEKDLEEVVPPQETFGNRYPKRRAASIAAESPAKRPAIPMGYTPLEGEKMVMKMDDQSKQDDDKEDISVVKLSAESAPADLPPCGEIIRPPLKTGMIIYAMRNAFGTWLKGRIMDVQPKAAGHQFTQCRVKFEHKIKNPCKVLTARCLAYPDPSEVRMTIGTRVVALFKDPHNTARRESFYSGVIAEVPNPVNSYRYLVFFDDGYAQYVRHQDTRIVCESSSLVWEEVHPFIRDFICNYLLSYPERPMVRLHAGEKLKTEWNGKWWDSDVLKVDASIALIHFDEDNRTEWIYRGSTRLAPLYLELQAAEKAGEGRTRSRAPRSKAQMRSNMPCVEYTRSDEPARAAADTQVLRHKEEIRRQRAVAKKSTTAMTVQPEGVVVSTPKEGTISRVVYYTPKNAVKPYKMVTHTCSTKCRRSDLLSLKDLRTYNPLSKPLLSGWERQTVRHKCHRNVFYRAPCGRRLRDVSELHKYLNIIQSDLSVDLFDFTPGTHCLSEFVLSKCIVSKKDLSHGKENVPVPCVNYYDDSLPEFCSYNTERTPTAGVPLNLDPEFLCGCDCTDDCSDKSKCACWKMTFEGARTIGLDGPNIGYEYRRLPEPLPSGIYECNSRCKCKQTCLNRVAQQPLQLKLQVFKTINRGWGIRALNDIPKGSFVCVYAGNLLTDATANLDGLNEGDEYLAELDYIEVVEGMKEGYENDVPDEDKKLDKKDGSDSDSVSASESEEEEEASKRDDDFQPGYILNSEFLHKKKSLRKREKAKKKEEEKKIEAAKKNECITISDDEEVREPSRFTAQAGMVDRDLITKQSSRVSVRTLYGKDEACYIMDAKVQGNIGRYLNHSCHPNVFVQNVFVDTHDPRFPWVAFFALSLVRAGTELTWNYNYDIGSVPEKVLYCYCGAPNCRGRLL